MTAPEHDRDDLTWSAHGVADTGVEEPPHHGVGGHEPERAPAGQRHGVDPLDQVARVEDVRLAGTGTTSANVNPSNGTALWSKDNRRPGEPAVAAAIGMPHPDAGHIGQAVGQAGLEDGHRYSLCSRALADTRLPTPPGSTPNRDPSEQRSLRTEIPSCTEARHDTQEKP